MQIINSMVRTIRPMTLFFQSAKRDISRTEIYAPLALETRFKMSSGNATTCDTTCDGVTTVRNAKDTACGELFCQSYGI